MEINFNDYYKNYINISKRNSWNYMYSKKIVKQKLDEINRLNNDIEKEQKLDGKILLDDKIKEIKRDLNTEPKKGKGTQLTQRGKRIFKRHLILQKKQRGNFTPLHPSPLRKERVIGGKKKRKSRKKRRKRTHKGGRGQKRSSQWEWVNYETFYNYLVEIDNDDSQIRSNELPEKALDWDHPDEIKYRIYDIMLMHNQAWKASRYGRMPNERQRQYPLFDEYEPPRSLGKFYTFIHAGAPEGDTGEEGEQSEVLLYKKKETIENNNRYTFIFLKNRPDQTNLRYISSIQDHGNERALFKIPVRVGGKKKRKSRKKRTKKKRKRIKRSSKKTYKKCAKFFTKKHKLTQKKALKMCKIMFG